MSLKQTIIEDFNKEFYELDNEFLLTRRKESNAWLESKLSLIEQEVMKLPYKLVGTAESEDYIRGFENCRSQFKDNIKNLFN